MAQPSKAAPAILTLFALPFLGGGLFFLYVQLVSRGNFKTTDTVVGMAIASFFVLVGGVLIFASLKGYGLQKKQAALEEANPLLPWLWRADWASRRAESQSQKSYIGAWVLAAFGNLFLFPFLVGMVPKLLRQSDPRVIIVLGFCSLGALLIVRAIRATLRHEHFGDTYFEFDSLPFSPGARVGGRIHLRFETQATHGINLRLTCTRRIVSGSGNNRSTSQINLWQADKNVPSEAIAPGPLGRAIPVDFELPADGLITDHSNSSDQVLWLLHAQADVPGVDYSDDFELPVFRTAAVPQAASDSQSEASAGTAGFGFAAARSVDADSGAVAQPARMKVVVSMHDGGTEFYFPPFRTPGRALVLLLVSVIFSGAAFALFQSHAPFFFAAIFSLGDLLVIFGFLHLTFGSARIGVGNGEILSRRGILGMGATRRTPFSEVASIVPVGMMQQGGNSWNVVYSIRMQTKDRKKLTLADEISSREEARWIVSQLETLAGLKLDTHVEMDLPLSVQAQPVQLRTVHATGRPQSTMTTVISFAIFVAMVAAMFAWQGKFFFAARARANNSRTAAPKANSVARRVFSGPMTDADTERVMALPPQAQAEELLERAIGHDTRALELLEREAGAWLGHIHNSDRIAQLVQRSQYSSDLRVRLANIDVSLALEGWEENEHAADLLIDRARTDVQYRAGAVFYLGMMAGRGVANDRIHNVLLDYARNDKDPRVRQWAVEGLRFLGKDEVLDELFTFFTEDPSMSVRNRAGCNISDCGIFTRKQRLRMAPKLIALAGDPSTNAQMRSWCFMALQGITDESLPADATAWNRWYDEHGAEKMAAFERLEWWQVRGDE